MLRCLLFVFAIVLSVCAYAGEVVSSNLVRLVTYMKSKRLTNPG